MALSIYSVYRRVQPIFRERRRRHFIELFRPTEETTILDVGGYSYDWLDFPVRAPITFLNVDDAAMSGALPSNFTCVRGDGRNLPFPDRSFDIVFSNSAIEHLPAFPDQRRFAAETLRVGRGIWVQTPNRWFPIEPHFIAPGVHYLPKTFQWPLIRWFSVRGWVRRGDNVKLEALFKELRLLSHGEMRALFPGCRILRERLCGLSKSFTAVRTAPIL